MRDPRNEQLDAAFDGDDASGPVRSCILTRVRAPRDTLIRLALAPDGRVLPDVRAKAPGRGAWIGVTRAELAVSGKKLRGQLSRAFKTSALDVPDDLATLVATALERDALDRLGLESRSGTVLTGSERIADAARAGRLQALYHAADASADGCRRLAQAWRVGSDREGSDLRGLVLPLPRPILSLALGRENVVHIGVTDRHAAKRLGDALGRWLYFIGPDQTMAPCETASHGASAPGCSGRDEAATYDEEFE